MGAVASAYQLALNGTSVSPVGSASSGGNSVRAAPADHVHGMVHGTAVLSLGTVTVAAPQVTASSVIMLTVQSLGGTLGLPYVSSRTPGTGFTISSLSLLDSSTVAWTIIG